MNIDLDHRRVEYLTATYVTTIGFLMNHMVRNHLMVGVVGTLASCRGVTTDVYVSGDSCVMRKCRLVKWAHIQRSFFFNTKTAQKFYIKNSKPSINGRFALPTAKTLPCTCSP